MSQDTAFSGNDNANAFNFPDETTTQDSQPEQSNIELDSSPEDKEEVEQRVPYSRFKKKAAEVDEYRSRIESLEQTLAQINTRNEEVAKPSEDSSVPKEWIELYGDSETSKRAWKVQEARENQLQEKAVSIAIQRLKAERENESKALEDNEAYIDDSLGELQEQIGRKLSPKMEEEILGIVDEFSQTGNDGKYVAMMPFDKAYEIYELRNAKKGLGTQRARASVADLTGNSSEGDIDSTDSPHKRGWDSWREAL